MHSYTSKQAARIVGLPFSTLDAWDRTGFIRASHASDGMGRGHGRTYTFRDLVALRVARELREHASLQTLRRAFAQLRKEKRDLSKAKLLAHGGRIYLSESEDAMRDLLSQQAVWKFVLDLGALERDVRKRLREKRVEPGGGRRIA